jgi:hypothetical protein
MRTPQGFIGLAVPDPGDFRHELQHGRLRRRRRPIRQGKCRRRGPHSDAPGNNRLDSFANIIATTKVGLLFLIPGLAETLRVNGSARLSRAMRILHCAQSGVPQNSSSERTVEAAYLHCAGAFSAVKL